MHWKSQSELRNMICDITSSGNSLAERISSLHLSQGVRSMSLRRLHAACSTSVYKRRGLDRFTFAELKWKRDSYYLPCASRWWEKLLHVPDNELPDCFSPVFKAWTTKSSRSPCMYLGFIRYFLANSCTRTGGRLIFICVSHAGHFQGGDSSYKPILLWSPFRLSKRICSHQDVHQMRCKPGRMHKGLK